MIRFVIAAGVIMLLSAFVVGIKLRPQPSFETIEESQPVNEKYKKEPGTAKPTEIHTAIETSKTGDLPEIITPAMLRGDSGMEGDLEAGLYMNKDESIPVFENMKTPQEMQNLILDYNGSIPYRQGGRDYGAGTIKYKSISPELAGDRLAGMDEAGYLIWVYRNVFGSCDPDFENPIDIYNKSEKIEIERLQVGDLGLYSVNPDEENNHFGIFVGLYDGIPVFSHCCSSWAENFPMGNNRLSYLKSATSRYYKRSEPVELNYFCRPSLSWREEKLPGSKEEEKIYE